MTTVFLSGSRHLSRINDKIRGRIRNMAAGRLHIIVGDANGADKAMQAYLAEQGYSDVTVYCSGMHCRNNIGEWATKRIDVEPKLRGRDFYAQKDKAMAKKADIGFVLWDGKSTGSVANALELLKADKKVVVYYAPEKEFYNLSSMSDIERLLRKCRPDVLSTISRKVELAGFPGVMELDGQTASALSG